MFVFYDFETTGTSPAFDQPLQFAAIRTDDDLNPQDQINIRCRLAPHVLPSPWAMVVTGVTPDMLVDPTLPSLYEFSRTLREHIQAWSPAVFTGFNSIRFDENVIRQTLYQNLHPDPYLTQINGNRRFDLMLAVYACWVMAPDILSWPRDQNGVVSFRLEDLAAANAYAEHHAHDALGDVRATIHLARLIRDRAPDVWNRMLLNTDKHAVRELVQTGDPVRLIARFGKAPPRSYAVAYSGASTDNPNEVGLFDIGQHDPRDLLHADDAALDQAVSASPKTVRTTALNKQPVLFPWVPDQPEDAGTIMARADALRAQGEFFGRVGAALGRRYGEQEPSEHVEEQIYDGFYTEPDKRLLGEFHQAAWEDRPDIVERIQDQRLRRLGMRVIWFERPDLVGEEYRHRAMRAIQERWQADESVAWTTLSQVEKELQEIEREGMLLGEGLERLRKFFQNLRRT